MLQTYTIIRKNFAVVNHLEYQEAKELAEDGDMILTIKDNHVSAIRKVTVEEYYGKLHKECDHIEKDITPFYQ
jgi:hypothetical protein